MNEELKAALIALGLTEEQATGYATLITVPEGGDINEIATGVQALLPTTSTQSQIDKRVTQGIKTAIENYEYKYGLKNGKTIVDDTNILQIPPIVPPITPKGTSPEMELMLKTIETQNKILGEVSQTVKTLSEQKTADERNIFVKAALTEAKIPEKLHKRFIDTPGATPEEFDKLVLEYKQELADSGIEMLQTPGGGGSTNSLELAAENAAKKRNNGNDDKGAIKGKEL